MQAVQFLVAQIGRLLLSAIFIVSGAMKLYDWSGNKQMLLDTINNLVSSGKLTEAMQKNAEIMADYSPLFLAIAALLEVIGGVMVALGYKPRVGAMLLLIFILPVTLTFHHFWLIDDPTLRTLETIMLMKNVAIIGGLLLVCAYGSGPKKTKATSVKHDRQPEPDSKKS